MPLVWLGKVDVPKKVIPYFPFDIYWREWFLVWPFKEYSMISKIKKESTGEEIEQNYFIKTWWFWGYRSHIVAEWEGLEEDEKYTIKVGWND